MKIVVTHSNESNVVRCAYCNISIAENIDGIMIPNPEICLEKGNVPIPNFGWFCSQECGINYEQKNNIKFNKNNLGEINYYNS